MLIAAKQETMRASQEYCVSFVKVSNLSARLAAVMSSKLEFNGRGSRATIAGAAADKQIQKGGSQDFEN